MLLFNIKQKCLRINVRFFFLIKKLYRILKLKANLKRKDTYSKNRMQPLEFPEVKLNWVDGCYSKKCCDNEQCSNIKFKNLNCSSQDVYQIELPSNFVEIFQP